MVEAEKMTRRCWWFDRHIDSPRRSHWLQSTLAELDEKTMAMLDLIEEDADSFAKRAEMFYKKRPELINLIKDFYRAHHSLAEQYNHVKSYSGTHHTAQWPSLKNQTDKLNSSICRTCDSYSETFDHPSEPGDSKVDDSEAGEESHIVKEIEEDSNFSGVGSDEMMRLREEVERLKECNKIQKVQLMQKDEEKKEAIRQLSFTVDVLKEENAKLWKCIARNSPKKWSPLVFNKLKVALFGRLFNGSPSS